MTAALIVGEPSCSIPYVVVIEAPPHAYTSGAGFAHVSLNHREKLTIHNFVLFQNESLHSIF